MSGVTQQLRGFSPYHFGMLHPRLAAALTDSTLPTILYTHTHTHTHTCTHKLVNGIDKVDKDDLLTERMQGLGRHVKKLRKGACLRDIKEYSFPKRSVEV